MTVGNGVGRNPTARLAPAATAAALVLLFHATWLTQGWGGAGATKLYDNVAFILIPLAAAGVCVWHGQRQVGRVRVAWSFLAASLTSWAAGQVAWTYYEEVAGIDVPFPSVADVGYLLFIPLAVTGLLVHPSQGARTALRVRTMLDGLIVALSLLFLSWAMLAEPVYGTQLPHTLEAWVGVAYPMGDVMLATIVLWVAIRSEPEARTSLIVVGAGFLFLAVADSGFAYLTAIGAYQTGNLIELGWVAGFLLIAVAPFTPGLGRARVVGDARTDVFSSAIPLFPFLIGIGVAIYVVLDRGALGGGLFWLGITNVLAVFARQSVTLLDNTSLGSSLSQANRNLRALELQRTQLLNNVAHDLMNPLGPLAIQLHLLSRSDTPLTANEQTQAFRVMRRSADQLGLMIQDLRDLAKIDAAQLKIQPNLTNLSPLLEEALESFRDLAAERDLRVVVDVPPHLPALADRARIVQVLQNLLTNALKFTPRGGCIQLTGRTASGDVHLTVADSGRGIAPTDMDRLFRPFSQLSDGSAKPGGTGLGLYVSKCIIEAHKGRIWASSDGPGTGAAFHVTLPSSA